MKNAVIIYQSKGGTTKQFGLEIANILNKNGLSTQVCSINECNAKDLQKADYIFLGCWTKGLMIFAQHPDAEWTKFVSSVSIPQTTCVGLFTTYKIATGKMFSKMKKALPGEQNKELPELKSKNGKVSFKQSEMMKQFVLHN